MVLLTDPTLVAPIYAKLPKDLAYSNFHYVRYPARLSPVRICQDLSGSGTPNAKQENKGSTCCAELPGSIAPLLHGKAITQLLPKLNDISPDASSM